jgi:hypothetical protein
MSIKKVVMTESLSQPEFLRYAMRILNLKRDDFSLRFKVPRSTLDKWMTPEKNTKEFRKMSDMATAYIVETLVRHVMQERKMSRNKFCLEFGMPRDTLDSLLDKAYASASNTLSDESIEYMRAIIVEHVI